MLSERVGEVAESAAAAAVRIADIVLETPLEAAPFLGDIVCGDVYCKLENRQRTGSFKLRGAANCLLSLAPEVRARGVVAASSGNHGAALASAARSAGVNAIIFVPEQTSSAKVEAIRADGGDIRFFGTDGLDTEQHAREFAARKELYYVSPYNDAAVVAGQGTCGVEISRQLPDADVVFIAVGGGGLLSGIGSVLKTASPDVRIVACQPEASPVMAKSVHAGRVLEMPSAPTLSDGTAGGIEQDSITFDLCRELADEFVLVSEDEIAAAMTLYMQVRGEAIEGAAGVALAALLRRRGQLEGSKAVVVICGGNVSKKTLESL